MRIVLLVAAALGGLTATPPCVPLIDKSPQPPESEPMLGVVINVPHSDITLPQGATLTIRWTAYNTTDKPASARLYVEARPDLTQTVLVDALAVSGTVTTATPWDTTQMPPAKYVIYAEITAGTRTERASASGRVKIDAPAKLCIHPTRVRCDVHARRRRADHRLDRLRSRGQRRSHHRP
jgi:hypothetical protein